MRGFHYRFYTTPKQKAALTKTFGCARYVFNWALNLRSTAWKERRDRINYAATSAALTELKRQPEVAWLNEVSCVPVQQSLRHLQTAFVNFWQNGAAYPNFKRRDGRQSAEFTRSGFQWENGKLTLAKIGSLDIRWSRRFTGRPSTVHVSRTRAGRYYVSFCVDEPLPVLPQATGQTGIDLGLTCFSAFPDGAKHHAPRPLRRKMAQLKRAQKALSRKRKGSRNRDRARLRVARQLEYKSAWHGRIFVRIDRWYPSSQLCSACGWRYRELSRDEREWTCQACRVHHNRDVNAAINILAEGLRILAVGLADSINACGGSIRPERRKRRAGNRRGSRNRSVCCAAG